MKAVSHPSSGSEESKNGRGAPTPPLASCFSRREPTEVWRGTRAKTSHLDVARRHQAVWPWESHDATRAAPASVPLLLLPHAQAYWMPTLQCASAAAPRCVLWCLSASGWPAGLPHPVAGAWQLHDPKLNSFCHGRYSLAVSAHTLPLASQLPVRSAATLSPRLPFATG